MTNLTNTTEWEFHLLGKDAPFKSYYKWVLVTFQDRSPLLLAGGVKKHSDLGLPSGGEVVAAGAMLAGGEMMMWSSTGYRVTTPEHLREPVHKFLKEKLLS